MIETKEETKETTAENKTVKTTQEKTVKKTTEKKQQTNSSNKKATSNNTEQKQTENKSVTVTVAPDSYKELDGGYAVGGQKIEIPSSWNY